MCEGLRSSVLIFSTVSYNFSQPNCPAPADVLVGIEQISRRAEISRRSPQGRSMKQAACQWAKVLIGTE